MSDSHDDINFVDTLNIPNAPSKDECPRVAKRPSYAVYDTKTGYGGPGLYWHGTRGTGDNVENVDYWVCSPIHAEATTASERGEDFGLYLRFLNSRWEWREWAMPMSLLKGSGEEMRGELLNLGMRISPEHRAKLTRYLMQQHPKREVLAATRTGWHGPKCFVLPHKKMGQGDVIYQSPYAVHDEFSTDGTLQGWQREIGQRCKGNAMLQLAICAALAGPLLERLHRTGCGIHFVGDSSTGKTTALHAAASIWGSSDFIRTWRATANGLEGAAAALNDTALILDEISEADAREVGAIVYALGNGVGKSRGAKTGGAKAVSRWKLILLSSGERSLTATMLEGGKRIKAGQEVRLLDIPCKRTYGVFDTLHDDNGRVMSDAMRTAAKTHYGHIGPAFIGKLIEDKNDLSADIAAYMTLRQFSHKESIEGRAATHFALFALAGELGIEYGLLPWDRDEALNAAAIGYQLWREFRGQGQTEDIQILQAVEDFLAKYGDSRFSNYADGDTGIRDRAGWWKWERVHGHEEEARTYMFTPTGLREALQGFDFKRALDALDNAGWIVERDAGRTSKTTRALGKKGRLYYVRISDSEN
jgi:putative DNA primase/helicase